MKTFTPAIYNFANPIGFDRQIAQIQAKLARITWMEAIFGRANVQWRLLSDEMATNYLKPAEGLKGRDKYTVYYPQGRKLNSDIDLSFDDTYSSRGFFYVKDNINISPKTDNQDWTSSNIEVAQPFSFIFSCNLNKLEIESSEQVKSMILYELGNCPQVVLSKIYEHLDDVWNDFTVTQQMSSVTKYPFYCLRVDGICTYMAFPFNGNDYFDPATNENPANESIVPNTDPGYANLN